MDCELLAYSAHGDSEDLGPQITFLAEQPHGLGEHWILLPASLLPPQSPHHLRWGRDALWPPDTKAEDPSRSPAAGLPAVALCGCLGPCWDRGGRMSLRAASSSILSHSSLCTHVCPCSLPSTVSLTHTNFQLPIGFGPLLAMTQP